MVEAVYILCMVTSLGCSVLLVRGYLRRRTALLLWSSICFVGLAVNNALLVVDLVLVPAIDLSIVRACTALMAFAVLIYGLVWETK